MPSGPTPHSQFTIGSWAVGVVIAVDDPDEVQQRGKAPRAVA